MSMFRAKKSSKDTKSKLQLLKRFISGEDITAEIVPFSYNVACLSTDELYKLKILQDYKEKHGIELIEPGWTYEEYGRVATYEDCISIIEKLKSPVVMIPASSQVRPSWATDEQIIWNEKKTYPDPEIEGVSYSNPENVPVVESKPIPTPVIERKKRIEVVERKETKPIIEQQEKDKEINTYSANTERGNRYVWINGKQVDIDEMGFNDVSFHGWINKLGRR